MTQKLALWWGAAAAGLILLSPFASGVAATNVPLCLFKAWTGFACPTCGTTRAALALARFDVWGALTSYPLPTVGWMAFISGGLGSAGLAVAGRPLPSLPSRVPAWARVSFVLVVLSNWGYSILTGV